MPTPERINELSVEISGESTSLREFLVSRGLKLIWTSHSLDDLGELSKRTQPYEWDEEERSQIRAEIDAAVVQSYELNRDDFEYILDSFEILKDIEMKEYGEYRRKKKCLAAFDRIYIPETDD